MVALAFLVRFLNFSQNVGLFIDNLDRNWQEPYGYIGLKLAAH